MNGGIPACKTVVTFKGGRFANLETMSIVITMMNDNNADNYDIGFDDNDNDNDNDDAYESNDDNTKGWMGTLICLSLIAASTMGPMWRRRRINIWTRKSGENILTCFLIFRFSWIRFNLSLQECFCHMICILITTLLDIFEVSLQTVTTRSKTQQKCSNVLSCLPSVKDH